jgi:NAD(P)-dependent dehydrogenase (short-subunit alcohol dehydrogenase family)
MTGNPQRLDGKVAIVTGAAGAIGGATAKLFLDLGAKVMLTDRDPAKPSETGSCGVMAADCTDPNGVKGLVGATVERFGKLDIMVANAGIEGALKPVDQLEIEDFEAVLKVNVIGIWLAIKHAVAVMERSGGGSIVALSSVAGAVGFPGMAAYTASKHAVFGLVKTAAIELGPVNIRVNAVAPGPIDSRMMQSLADQLGSGDPHGFRTFVEGRVPMGRYGTNEEIAQLVAFLASDAASYCSGGLYLADGGYAAA